MIKELRFAFYAIKKNIQGSAELRTSFLANIIGMAINNTTFIIIWVFFVRSVGVINGWTAIDIVGMLGFGALSYGVVFSVAFGIRKLPDYVANGGFDRFMLSPKNLLIRIGTSSFNASAVGDVVFGITCLLVYSILTQISVIQILMIMFSVFISILVFLAVTITIYSLSFLFVDASAVTSGIFELFITPTIFHGGAFQGVMRFIFTFIIPSLSVGALPVEIVKSVSFGKLIVIGVVAIVWFFISLRFFNRGVRKYESTNFMTFGT